MALDSGSITRGSGEWGHLQVALESEGIYRWLWRVGANPGGSGDWGHLQVALECGGHLLQVALESVPCGHHQVLWRVGASPGGFGE